MALQLIEAFQCSVIYSTKQTSSFFDCCNAFIDFIVCDCSLTLELQLQAFAARKTIIAIIITMFLNHFSAV